MATGISYLDQITPEKDDWKIRVRVIQLWRQHAYKNPMEPMSLDMVLMDEEGEKIHATVKRHLLMKVEPLLQEGSVYVISNFGVAENTSGFKMVRHSYRINFYRMTLVKAYTSQFVGSRYGLDFKQFDDILSKTVDLGHAYDIVGLIIRSFGLSVTTNDGKGVKMMAFQLTDIGQEISRHGDYSLRAKGRGLVLPCMPKVQKGCRSR